MKFLLLALLAGCAARAATPDAVIAPPGAPTDIDVQIVDRRATSMQVCWRAPAPASWRLDVIGFDLRYARVPITADNFDDPMVTVKVPVAARPPFAGGARVCQLVEKLYIETGYYFAVEAVGDAPPPPPPRPGGPNT